MTLRMMEKIGADFQKAKRVNPLDNPKSRLKLQEASEKCKKVLSANLEAPLHVECLINDEDLSVIVKREDFESWCSDLSEQLKNMLNNTLQKSNIPLEKISAVEIIGGASRVPWVHQAIDSVFKRELGKTLNADESVARGCALQAAMLSPMFKVRDFECKDSTTNRIILDIKDGDARGTSKSSVLFEEGSPLDFTKSLALQKLGPFHMAAYCVNPFTEQKSELGVYTVNLPPREQPAKVKILARLDLSGVFNIEGAQLLEEYEVEELVSEPVETPEPGKDAEMGNNEENVTECVKKLIKKKKIKKTDISLSIAKRRGYLSSDQLQNLKNEETLMLNYDNQVIATKNLMNELESYIYYARDKMNGQWEPYLHPKEKQPLESSLEEAERWLWDNQEAPKNDYAEKLEYISKLGNVIKNRCEEHQGRTIKESELRSSISNIRVTATNDQQYSHIPMEDRKKVVDECNKVESWLNDMSAKQSNMQLNVDPVLLVSDINSRKQETEKMANAVLSKPPPPPPKDKSPPPSQKSEETTSPSANEDAPMDQD
eukprot:GHVL01036906.1.p1 GENE.GHVL01036906.1~~GHVL01036906.1.p1  ORF type:complete len:544 (+),score=119.22 GHVL01036906.1:953-2584(+)